MPNYMSANWGPVANAVKTFGNNYANVALKKLELDRQLGKDIYDAAKTEAPPIANNYVSGLTHIAFYTDSFEEIRQRLLAAGVEPAAEPVIRPYLKLALMRDGEGNLFHITQRDRALISARV